MKKYGWLIAILGVAALGIALVFGAAFGAGITYFFLHADPVQAALAAPVEVDEGEGVLVSGVKPDSAAAEAGLVRGDIILEVNTEPVNNLFELQDLLTELEPGDVIQLTVLHGDETRKIEFELDDMQGLAYLGIGTCDVPKSGTMMDIKKEAFIMGAEIVEVVADSPAEEAGLQVGDLILSVNAEKIGPEASLADLIQAYEPGDEVTLKVQTGEADEASEPETRDVVVTLGENPDNPGMAYLGVAYQAAMSGLDFEDGEFPFMETLPFGELPEGFEGEEGIPKFFFHHGDEFDGELPEGLDEDGEFYFHGVPGMPFDMGELPEGVDGAVIISEVMEGTPAADAGLQPGDLIIAVDGKAVTEIETFVEEMQSRKPGDEVTLTTIREGEESEVTVILTEHPDNPEKGFLGVLAGTFTIMENMELPEGFDQDFELEIPGASGGDA